MRRKLKDIIADRPPVSASITQSALDAAKLIASNAVGSIIVTDGQRLQGIVTERDLITRVLALGRNPETVKLAEIMTPHPVVMPPDKLFSHALLAMADGGFRHMPVVEGLQVLGVVSIRDALGVEHEELDRLRQALDSTRLGSSP